MKKLNRDQRFRNHPRNKAKACKADRKVKTIAGRLVHELERNLAQENPNQKDLALFKRILAQKRTDKNKIYSIHEPETCCISEGKEHKKYEFGNKAAIAKTSTGVIVGALGFRNPYDGHTLEPLLEQTKKLTGKQPKIITADRGCKGKAKIGETQILVPKPPKKNQSR